MSDLTNPGGRGYGGNPDAANQFTTGSVGLTITGVSISWSSGGGGAAPQVGIFTDNAGVPSTTQVGTWFTNSTTVTATPMTYSGSATLSPSTTYWMVIKIADSSRPYPTPTFSPTTDPSTQGAALVATSAYGNVSAGTWVQTSGALIFSLDGTIYTPPVNASVDLKETDKVTTTSEEITIK